MISPFDTNARILDWTYLVKNSLTRPPSTPITNGGAMGRAKEFVVGIGVSRCEEFVWGVGASNPTFTIGSLSSISRAGNRLMISLSIILVR